MGMWARVCACMYICPCVHIHTSPHMHMPVGGSDCQQLGGLTGGCLRDQCRSWNPQGRQTGRQDGGKQEENRDRLECTHWSPHRWAGARLSSICLSSQLHTGPAEAPYSQTTARSPLHESGELKKSPIEDRAFAHLSTALPQGGNQRINQICELQHGWGFTSPSRSPTGISATAPLPRDREEREIWETPPLRRSSLQQHTSNPLNLPLCYCHELYPYI